MRGMTLFLAILLMVGCEFTEVKREIGYKGRARVNPWLAAERFCESYPGNVRSLANWSEPTAGDAVWLIPASLLGNASFTRRLTEWVRGGGHLIVMVDHAEAGHDDWLPFPSAADPEPAFVRMLGEFGISFFSGNEQVKLPRVKRIRFDAQNFAVDLRTRIRLAAGDGKRSGFVSVAHGAGRLSVVADGRIFRNRWIGEKDHVALLDVLIRATGREGDIGFTRGDALSLWSLVREFLWPMLVALLALVVLWLWKNLRRFGPLDSADEALASRGFEHHLEALGDFQWRLDRAAGLLGPVRSRIVERGKQACLRSGRSGDDVFRLLADLTGIPGDRIARALSDSAPPDAAQLTRTTADLQCLLKALP